MANFQESPFAQCLCAYSSRYQEVASTAAQPTTTTDNTSLHRPLLPQLLPLLPPSATTPPNARLNPQLPIAVAFVHCDLAALPPSFAPPPPPPPIAIVPPVGHSHHCLQLQLCCQLPPPAAAHIPPPLHAIAHMLLLLHAVARTPHPLPAAAYMLAACRPLQSCPQLPPPAAPHTHTACCRTHAAAAAYCCTHASSITAPVTTAISTAAGAVCIDSIKKGKH